MYKDKLRNQNEQIIYRKALGLFMKGEMEHNIREGIIPFMRNLIKQTDFLNAVLKKDKLFKFRKIC